MPHGITVDFENNVWVTDVALHQVFKFGPKGGVDNHPLLELGIPFIPGKDRTHFCKPTDVAIMKNGDFFVSDGYCNSRVLKYSSNGEFLMEWGRSTFFSSVAGKMPMPYEFSVPHALALAEDQSLICVADRENGRVQCFDCHNGTFAMQLYSPVLGNRIFSVAYAPVRGLYRLGLKDYIQMIVIASSTSRGCCRQGFSELGPDTFAAKLDLETPIKKCLNYFCMN